MLVIGWPNEKLLLFWEFVSFDFDPKIKDCPFEGSKQRAII